jgi:hypothetical protein
MTLIEQAAEKMKAKKGDFIAFYEEDGKIVIEGMNRDKLER